MKASNLLKHDTMKKLITTAFIAAAIMISGIWNYSNAQQIDQAKEDQLGLKSGADPTNLKPEQAGSSRRNGKPVLFIIGDSTVKNGRGDGSNKQWGWGSLIAQFLDTTKISVENHAIGGRSSRTFIEEGRWQRVLDALQPGDYVTIQFGHNDSGPYNTGRARAVLKGNHDRDTTVIMEATGKPNTIYSFGWYMRKYANEALAKGANPIILSHIPRNNFVTKDSLEIIRNDKGFGAWCKEAADQTGAKYIDFNGIIADKYEEMGKDSVQLMFQGDHTHTSWLGAELNAKLLATELKKIIK